MPKVLKNFISSFISCILSLTAIAAIILRIIQLIKCTDPATGHIIHSARGTMLYFYLICAVIILLTAMLSYNIKDCVNPFEYKSNEPLAIFSFFAGLSLFYDFVHQTLNLYEYIASSSQFQVNYIIPLALVAISALASSFYFFLLALYFISNKYDFRQLKYIHLMPTLWILFKLLVCIVTYVDERYAEEAFFEYAVLIFGISFFILLMRCIDDKKLSFRHVIFTGISYGICALIISVPRIIVFLAKIETYNVSFSSITYFLTGIFALIFSFSALESKYK